MDYDQALEQIEEKLCSLRDAESIDIREGLCLLSRWERAIWRNDEQHAATLYERIMKL